MNDHLIRYDYLNNRLVVYPDSDDEFTVAAFPVVCPRCNGNGVHDHEAFSNGLTSEDLSDPDFREDYISGVYDVTCTECAGRRVTLEADDSSPDYERYLDALREAAASRAEEEAERRLGLW